MGESWHSIGVIGPEKGRFRFGGTGDKEFQERCGQGVLGLRNRAGTSGAASWRGTAWPIREPRTVVRLTRLPAILQGVDERLCSSKTSGTTLRTTRRHIPEDNTLQNHRCENLKSYKYVTVCFILHTTTCFDQSDHHQMPHMNTYRLASSYVSFYVP
jgi:hypothetical protein